MSEAFDKYFESLGEEGFDLSDEELDRISKAGPQRGGFGSELAAGVYQGMQSTGASVEGLKATWYDYIGNDEARDEAVEAYEAHNAAGERYGPDISRIEDINSASDFGSWFAGTVIGANLPFAATLVGPQAVASGAAKIGATKLAANRISKMALRDVQKSLVKKKIQGGMSKKAAEKAVAENLERSGSKYLQRVAKDLKAGTANEKYQKLFAGATKNAGKGTGKGTLLGTSVGLETGLIGGELGAEHGDIDVGTTLKFGTISGGIGAMGASRLINRVIGGKGMVGQVSGKVKKAATEGLKKLSDAGYEGGTEAAQELMNIFASRESRGEDLNLDLSADEQSQVMNAAAAGGMAAVGMTTASDAARGVVSAADAKVRPQQPPPPPAAEPGNLSPPPAPAAPQGPPVPTSPQELDAQLDNMKAGGRRGVLFTGAEDVAVLNRRRGELKAAGYKIRNVTERQTGDPSLAGWMVYKSDAETAKLLNAGRFNEVIGQPSTGRPENALNPDTPVMTTRDAQGIPVLDTQVDQTNAEEANASHAQAREATPGATTENRTSGQTLDERTTRNQQGVNQKVAMEPEDVQAAATPVAPNQEPVQQEMEFLVDNADPQNMKIIRNPNFDPDKQVNLGESPTQAVIDINDQLTQPKTAQGLAEESMDVTRPEAEEGPYWGGTTVRDETQMNVDDAIQPLRASTQLPYESREDYSPEQLETLLRNEEVEVPGEVFVGQQNKKGKRKTPEGRSRPYRRKTSLNRAVRELLADPWYQRNYPPYNPETGEGIWSYLPVEVVGGYKINITPHPDQIALQGLEVDMFDRKGRLRGVSDTVDVERELSEHIITPHYNAKSAPKKVEDNPNEYVTVISRGVTVDEDMNIKSVQVKASLHIPSIMMLGKKILSAQGTLSEQDLSSQEKLGVRSLVAGVTEIVYGDSVWSENLSKTDKKKLLDLVTKEKGEFINPNTVLVGKKRNSTVPEKTLGQFDAAITQEELAGSLAESKYFPDLLDNERYLPYEMMNLRLAQDNIPLAGFGGKKLSALREAIKKDYRILDGAAGVLPEHVSEVSPESVKAFFDLANAVLATDTVYYGRSVANMEQLQVSAGQQGFISGVTEVIQNRAAVEARYAATKDKRIKKELGALLDYSRAHDRVVKNVESYMKARAAAIANPNPATRLKATTAYGRALFPLMEQAQKVAAANSHVDEMIDMVDYLDNMDAQWEQQIYDIERSTGHVFSIETVQEAKNNAAAVKTPPTSEVVQARMAESSAEVAEGGRLTNQERAEAELRNLAVRWHTQGETLRKRLNKQLFQDIPAKSENLYTEMLDKSQMVKNIAYGKRGKAIAEFEAMAKATQEIITPGFKQREGAFVSKRQKTLRKERAAAEDPLGGMEYLTDPAPTMTSTREGGVSLREEYENYRRLERAGDARKKAFKEAKDRMSPVFMDGEGNIIELNEEQISQLSDIADNGYQGEKIRSRGSATEEATQETFPGGRGFDQGTEHTVQLGEQYSTKGEDRYYGARVEGRLDGLGTRPVGKQDKNTGTSPLIKKAPRTVKKEGKSRARQQDKQIREEFNRDSEIANVLFTDMADGPDINDVAVMEEFLSQVEQTQGQNQSSPLVSTFDGNSQVKQVNLGGAGGLNQKIGSMIASLHTTLGIKNPIVVMDSVAIQQLAGKNLDYLVQNYNASSRDAMKQALQTNKDMGGVTLMPSNDQAPIIIASLDAQMEGDFVESVMVMGHEMGHVLFNVTKKSLQENPLQYKAMENKYKQAVEPSRRDNYSMDEWMGDQFALQMEDFIQDMDEIQTEVRKEAKTEKEAVELMVSKMDKRLQKYPPMLRKVMRGMLKIWESMAKHVNEYRAQVYQRTGSKKVDTSYQKYFQSVVNTQRARAAAVAAYKRAMDLHPMGALDMNNETVEHISDETGVPRSEYHASEKTNILNQRRQQEEEATRARAERIRVETQQIQAEMEDYQAKLNELLANESIDSAAHDRYADQTAQHFESEIAVRETQLNAITEMVGQDAKTYARQVAANVYRSMQRAQNDTGSPITPIRWRGSADIIDPQHFSAINAIHQAQQRAGKPNAIMDFATGIWTKHFVTVHKVLHSLPDGDSMVELLEKESGTPMTERQKKEGFYEHAYHNRMGRDIDDVLSIVEAMPKEEQAGLALALSTPNGELTSGQRAVKDMMRQKAEQYRAEQINIRNRMAREAGIPLNEYNASNDPSVLQIRDDYWSHMYRSSKLNSEEGRATMGALMDQYVRPDWQPVRHSGSTPEQQWTTFKEEAIQKLIHDTTIEQTPDQDSSYAWNNAKQRLYNIPTRALVESGLIATNPSEVLQMYYRNSARVIEFERRFGGVESVAVEDLQQQTRGAIMGKLGNRAKNELMVERAKIVKEKMDGGMTAEEAQADTPIMTWNSGLKVKEWLDMLERDHGPGMASDGRWAMDAVQGKLDITSMGRDPKIRFGKDVFLLAAHAILLPLAIFASLADAGVMMSRNDSGFKPVLRKIRANFKEAYTRNPSDLHRMAKSYGIISERAAQHALMDVSETGEFGAVSETHAKVQKWQEKFFKYNGLEGWTVMTRLAATELGIDFMNTNAEKAEAGDTVAQARMEELGISPEDVHAWEANGRGQDSPGDARVVQALQIFVDESVMRPGATRRPATASDPIIGLLHSLHQFMYLFKTQVMDRLMAQAKAHGTLSPELVRSAAPLVYLVPIAMMGLAMRDAVYYAGTDDEPERDFWDIVSRTGILGPLTMIFDSLGWGGGLEGARRGLGGGAPGVAWDALTTNPVRTAGKIIPLKAGRSFVGELTDG